MRSEVVGYEVFYSMSDVDDLDIWQRKTVGLVTSIDLVNLERHAQVQLHKVILWDCFINLFVNFQVYYFVYKLKKCVLLGYLFMVKVSVFHFIRFGLG